MLVCPLDFKSNVLWRELGEVGSIPTRFRHICNPHRGKPFIVSFVRYLKEDARQREKALLSHLG